MKCKKCGTEYNHYKDICPPCRGEVINDVLDHIDDIEMFDPYMKDEKEGNNRDHAYDPMADPRMRRKKEYRSERHAPPMTKGTRR